MRVNVYVVIALLCVSSLVAAAERPTGDNNDKDTSFERAVDICVEVVKKELPFSSFDAYVENNTVKMFGTPESHFKFEKCMEKRGQPLNKK